jgi:hypothetical protein
MTIDQFFSGNGFNKVDNYYKRKNLFVRPVTSVPATYEMQLYSPSPNSRIMAVCTFNLIQNAPYGANLPSLSNAIKEVKLSGLQYIESLIQHVKDQ